jgi:hypothetical protein
MIFSQIKATLGKQLSQYSTERMIIMRNGKYTSGMHYSDGYSSMLFETIMELEQTEDYEPLDKSKTRELVSAFNRVTGTNVPGVWTD